jgi:hypothetical protein
MKKLINEAFRLQQIAGLKPAGMLNEISQDEHFLSTVEEIAYDEGLTADEIDKIINTVEADPRLFLRSFYDGTDYNAAARETIQYLAPRLGIKLQEKLDPVGHEDADIDNDGDTDKSDEYLANRRKAISKNMNEGEDHEVAMAQASLKAIISSASQLMNKIGHEEINIPAWIQDHITNSENYIEQANQGYHELCDKDEEGVQVAIMEKDEE